MKLETMKTVRLTSHLCFHIVFFFCVYTHQCNWCFLWTFQVTPEDVSADSYDHKHSQNGEGGD